MKKSAGRRSAHATGRRAARKGRKAHRAASSPRNDSGPPRRRSDALIRAILDTVVDGIVTIDHRGIIDAFNPAAERIFGYRADEVIGRNVSILMPAPYRQEHDHYISLYLKTGQAKIIGIGREVVGRRKNGTIFPMDLAVSEVRIGKRRMFTGIVRDITERKRVEKALEDERNFVSAVLDTAGALVVVLDTEGRTVRCNRASEIVTGYAFDEIKGRRMWDLFVPPEEVETVKNVFKSMWHGKFPLVYENHWLTKGGHRRLIAWSNTAVTDQKGSIVYIIATGIDITERRKAEEALASVSERERQRFGRELHDGLGQQLTGIALLAKALERKLSGKEHHAERDAADIAVLTGDALNEVKRHAHSLYPIELEKHGLSIALAELALNQERLFRIKCTFEGNAELPELETHVALHLYRIAQEAISNAIKHGQATRVRLILKLDERALTLTIIDNGAGIPDKIPDHGGMGMSIMGYRASTIGARLLIQRIPEGGTMIRCVYPASKSGQGAKT